MSQLNKVLTFGLLKRSLCASRSTIYAKRFYSSQVNVQSEIDKITDLFFEARDELEYATESKGSVYYNDEKAAAQEVSPAQTPKLLTSTSNLRLYLQAVTECLKAYDALLERLNEAQKNDVQRKIGLKIFELRSQLDALTHEELHD
ncbi:hypothetical protein K493DRAFT_303549 [Basidiobolus meristosporus CBS 931.73]|uniref:Uncharacterized protein n=1 Tax=Basidiobolus meristosporus CBS 931.73 TaxID=1314790 RepID=A0A1Y1Y346_9FUNG|nr:hypothetical protein K493DRAFT_303549 [Basidiobolus meristosporus CBS 931.73]|eukprot:ORX92136.1 hypothetical protein K493DRAFT_303549 [Basidiobolus meristosporus CBS 931.73]